jgi:nicotinamide-nucleotide amidase
LTGAGEVVRWLTGRAQTLAVAESLTGGLLAAAIVAVPGASTVFRGGLVVYATDLKESLAGVPAELLAARGPVDPEVAVAMAEGARERCRADWGLATTGVAGPDPQDGAPPGRVYVAVAGPAPIAGSGAAPDRVRSLTVPGDRAAVREAAVAAALALLPVPA